jgi:hypothetical protein
LISSEENFGKALEWILHTFALEGTDFKEFESDTLGKGETILRPDSNSILQIDLGSNNNSHKWLALILLLDSLEPLSEEMESIRISYIINQHNEICFAKELKSNLFENILTSDVNKVQFNSLIRFSLNWNLLDVVFATLSHHVIVVEVLLANLIY